MQWVVSAVGAVLVMVALRDIFHTLWHPIGRGGLSRLMMRAVWRLCRRLVARARLLALAGTLGMVAVVAMWAAIIVLGWLLIYLPHMPDGFSYDPGLDPQARAGFLDALYLSLVTVGTLGYGDIVPEAGWLLVAAPLQALVGFVLLSAAVSWASPRRSTRCGRSSRTR